MFSIRRSRNRKHVTFRFRDLRAMNKLRNKFLVYVLVPALMITALMSVLSYLEARRIVVNLMKKSAVVGLQQALAPIEAGAGRGMQTLETLAVAERNTHLTDEQRVRMYRELVKTLPLDVIFMGFPDGRLVAGADNFTLPPRYDVLEQTWYRQALAPQNLPMQERLKSSDQAWYRQMLKGEAAIPSSPQISVFSSHYVLILSRRVTDKEGRLIGVMGYEIPLSHVRKKLAEVALIQEFKGTVCYVFTAAGEFLMHTDESRLHKKLTDSDSDLTRQMWDAVTAGQETWYGWGPKDGGRYFAGFRKSTFGPAYLGVEIPFKEVLRPYHELIHVDVLVMLLGLGSLSIILVKMAAKIAQPLHMLADAAGRVTNGDYTPRLPVDSNDELAEVADAFNKMAEGLEQRDFIRNTFGRYISPEVVTTLLDSEDGLKLGGETRDISVLISDLRGFTFLTENLPPQRVIELLNRYMGKMLEILLDNGAIVDELVGDGILAFLGAPNPMHDHPARAVTCALKMQAAMDEINAMNEADGLPRLEMGIGVNTGSVVVGNIGSERRTKYGIVGSCVNFAGRIESYTVGGQILISESTYERIKDLVTVRDEVRVEMKGFGAPVSLYDVTGIRGPYRVDLNHSNDPAPRPIKHTLPIRVQQLDGKVVTSAVEEARITHLSESQAVILMPIALNERADVKIEILTDGSAGEVFAKVVTVKESGSMYESLVIFTYLPFEVRAVFRRRFAEA
ncbi:MAG: adenylate/guanylate cyclase domain-containing protein [Pseudomonadota bacterium]